MSQQQLDLAKSNYDSASASVGAADANVTQAQAQVSQKDAAVAVAQTNLDYTVIRSPIDGTVVARNVDVGQTVAASLQAPTIFTIAQDLTKMWVYAKTDESDVGNIKIGKPVSFKVDAFPKDTFHGVVSQVRMNATTVQSVVTYDTIIEFANPELKLFPGMTAYVTIPVDTVKNAMKLPNTALRYKPPMSAEEILAIYKQYGIDASEQKQAVEEPAASGTVAGNVGQTGAAMAAQNPPRVPKRDSAVVWKLHADNTMEPVKVSLGITDHAFTEVSGVIKGALKEGDDVIIRSLAAKSQGLGGIRR
jgi:HlyD family secretion protein